MQPFRLSIVGPCRAYTATVRPSGTVIRAYRQANRKFEWIFQFKTCNTDGCRRRNIVCASSGSQVPAATAPLIQSDIGAASPKSMMEKVDSMEESMEKAIYRCRFLAFLGVFGSLIGSVICFVKGCTHVVESFTDYFVNRGRVIISLVEAIDVYLLGTVMLVFGVGLYEIFISNLGSARSLSETTVKHRSNLFGFFPLKERPKWLDITTVNELKTKLGHVIVMLLLIGFFDKSKKAVIQSPTDLLCLAVSVFLSSGSLFLLSKLTDPK